MSDPIDSSSAINVGDAVMRFLGDTTDLERAWTELEGKSTESATRTVNKIGKLYDQLNIDGSASLRDLAQKTQESFEKLSASGMASMGDLIQAEQRVIETQIALKESLGQSVPAEVLDRLASLQLQYVGLTGSAEQFAAAQQKFISTEQQAARAAEATAAALVQEQRAYGMAGQAALTAANQESEANAKSRAAYEAANAGSGSGKKGIFGNAGTIAMGILEYQAIMAIVSGLQEGFKAAMDFDKAFAELSTLIDTSTPEGVKQVAMLKEQLLALPPALGDITELTKAMYEAISAGIAPGLAVEFVAKAAVFAKAALMDQFTAVKLVTTAMKSYGIGVVDADKVTSALFATIQNGKLRGPELADSLGRVLQPAAALRVSLTEVLGAADALTQGGVSAEMAMTELRQVLATIEHPSKQSEEAIKELGLSFGQVRAEIRDKGLLATLQDLGGRLNGNNELTAKLFGNVRALGGVFSLTGAQAVKYKENVEAITKAYNEGTAAQQAMDKILNSQSGQWELFGNTVKNKFLNVWTQIAPISNEIAKAFVSIVVDSQALGLAMFALVTVGLTLATVLGTVAIFVEALKSGFIALAYVEELTRQHLHAFSGSMEDMKKHVEELNQASKDADAAARAHAAGIRDSLDAFDKFMKGTGGGKMDEFAAQQKKAAQATEDLAAAQKKLSDQQSADTQKQQEEKDRLEDLAKAAKKAQKAMDEYAKAHNIPLDSELRKAVETAKNFYEMLVKTHAPLESQNTALLNYTRTLGTLNQLEGDKRPIGQFLQDIGGKTKAIEEWHQTVTTHILNPYDEIIQAESNLGIQGSASFAEFAASAKVDLANMRGYFAAGVVSAEDLQQAINKVADADNNLAISLGIDVRSAMEKVLDAENKLGVEGTAALRKHSNELHAAMDALAKLAKNNPGAVSLLDLQKAQLRVMEADAAMKAQLGKPIGGQAYSDLVKMTAAMQHLQTTMDKNFATDVKWAQFWTHTAPTVSQTMHQIGEDGKEALMDLSSGMQQAVVAYESGQKSLGQAVKDAVQQTLEAWSAQEAIHALIHTADGFAALAIGDGQAATNFFEAAALEAAVAVAAGAAGMAMGTSGGGSSGSAASGSPGAVGGASQGQVNPVQTTNVQRFAGGGLVSQPTLAIIGDSKHSVSRGATEAVLPLDDPEAMAKIREGLGSTGGTHFHIEGVISSDNLGDVMDQMSAKVRGGKTLVASHANRVVRKS